MPVSALESTTSLRQMYLEHCTQGRHHETQRSLVMSATTAIASAICSIVVTDHAVSRSDLPLAIIVVALGLFGALFSLKHYERFRRHMEMAGGFRDALDQMLPGAPMADIRKRADAKHRQKFPLLSRLRLNHLWLGLHVFLAMLGLWLAVTAWGAPT